MAIDLTLDPAIMLSTDGFGETVTFTPNGGVARDLTGRYFDGYLDADPDTEPAEYRRPTFLTASADVSDLTHKATILRGGVTYTCMLPDISELKNMPFILIELQKA